MKNFLLEILCEELPGLPLLKELPNIKNKFLASLEKQGFKADLDFFYTPRRLVFCSQAFPEFSQSSKEEFFGAAKSIAMDANGAWTKAAQAFAAKHKLKESELEFKTVQGKELLFCEKIAPPVAFKDKVQELLEDFVHSLNFGKSMRWGENSFSFIRPIKSTFCLLGAEFLPYSLLGLESSNKTLVHRALERGFLEVKDFASYFKILQDNFVLLSQEARRERILEQIAAKEENLKVQIDEELLSEVAALTEWPRALLGSFDEDFLRVPQEAITLSMKEHQRYFSVHKNGALTNNFIVISNSISPDQSLVINGNERVLRARLSDALFFWENDLKTGLNPELLKSRIYMQELGTLEDKMQREKTLALKLAKTCAFSQTKSLEKAISYSKCDLFTQMVGEFGDLQGIIAGHLASHMGLGEELAKALREQYYPLGDGATLPERGLAAFTALSIKLETLMGLFSIKKIPSGSKDPYALRRAALGALRIIIDNDMRFNIEEFLLSCKELYKDFNIDELIDFIMERFYALYNNLNPSFVTAILCTKSKDIANVNECIKALDSLSKSEGFSEGLASFKRLRNISKDMSFITAPDTSLFMSDAEKNLYEAFMCLDLVCDIQTKIVKLFSLKQEVDTFFDEVLINVEDEKIRKNRQALVMLIQREIEKIADFKELNL